MKKLLLFALCGICVLPACSKKKKTTVQVVAEEPVHDEKELIENK